MKIKFKWSDITQNSIQKTFIEHVEFLGKEKIFQVKLHVS